LLLVLMLKLGLAALNVRDNALLLIPRGSIELVLEVRLFNGRC
jgi:hypothetical protein